MLPSLTLVIHRYYISVIANSGEVWHHHFKRAAKIFVVDGRFGVAGDILV
jgi:hypothetical protein